MRNFDFGKARSLGSDDEIVDYLRNHTKNTANWEQIDNALANMPNKATATIDFLSRDSSFVILDNGFTPQKTAQDALEIAENITPKGLIDKGAHFIQDTFNTKEAQNRAQKRQELQEITNKLNLDSLNAQEAKSIQEGLDLPLGYKNASGAVYKDWREAGLFEKLQEQSPKEALIEQQQKEAKLEGIFNKDYEDLQDDEIQLYRDSLSDARNFAMDYLPFVADEAEYFEDFKAFSKAKKEIVPEVNLALEQLNGTHRAKQFRALFNSSEENLKANADYLENVTKVVEKFGFSGSGLDEEGNLYLIKDSKLYRVNDGFFENFSALLSANKMEIAGGITGAIAGAKSGAKFGKAGVVAGGIVGSALGSMAGSVSDDLMANAALNRNNAWNEIYNNALEAGYLSLAGDGVILGLSKMAKPALKGISKAIGKALDATIIGGFVRNLPTQNLRGAQEILKHTYTDADKESLKAFSESFGGSLQYGRESLDTEALKAQVANLPQFLQKGALNVLESLNKKTLKDRQLELLEQVRSDKSGNTLAFLIEAANTSPEISNNLRSILNQTTAQLNKELQNLGLPQNTILSIFKDLEKQTKNDYDEAINKVLSALYKDAKPEVIARDNYLQFRARLEASGVLPAESESFLKFVENTIYNPLGVNFETLHNAKKVLNSYYKNTSDPNFKDTIKKSVQGFLRDDINKGLDKIFAQNPQKYLEAKKLYESALSDYATMKEVLKLKGVKSAMDSTKSAQNAQDALFAFIKAQGNGETSNLELIKKALRTQGSEELELGLLQSLINKSFIESGNIEDGGLKVFDSNAFKRQISGLESVFESKASKEVLDLINGFHRLFSNDGAIALALKPANTTKEGYGLATSIEGAAKQKAVKIMFENILRNLPNLAVPLTPIKFSAFNERIQGAALRFHLRSALKNSINVEDFKAKITQRTQRANFNTPTRELLKDFLKVVENSYNDGLNALENIKAQDNAKLQEVHTKQALKEEEINNFTPIEKEVGEAQEIPKDKEVLNKKVSGNFAKEELDNLPLSTQQEWDNFLTKIESKDYQNTPEILKIATLNDNLKAVINKNQNGNVFITRAIGGHIREERKGIYRQALRLEEKQQIPNIINNATTALKDKDSFIIPFEDTMDSNKMNLILLKGDEKGNFIVTAKKVNKGDFENKQTAGVEPATTTQNAQNSTESISSVNSNAIISQNAQGDYLFTLENGKKTIIRKELADKWKETFNLQSVDDDFTPNIPQEIREILGGDIHLKIGSLAKIAQRERGAFIEFIKPTLENPNAIIKHLDGFIFIKDIGKDKVLFTSIVKDDKGEIIVVSNAFKTKNALKNKFKDNAEVLYISGETSNLLAEVFNVKAFSNKPLDAIITQNIKNRNAFFQQIQEKPIGEVVFDKNLPELPIIAKPELPAKALNSVGESSTNSTTNPINTQDNAKLAQVHKEAALKETESLETTQEIPKEVQEADNLTKTLEILESNPSKGRDMQVIGLENFTEEVLDYAILNNKTIPIDYVDSELSKQLGFKYENAKYTITPDAINHILKRHGKDSALVKNGAQETTKADILNYPNLTKEADKKALGKDNLGQDILISGKQINGHYVIVESIRKKNNELSLKSMYFENGNLEDSKAFIGTQTLLHGYEPDTNSFVTTKPNAIIPQKDAFTLQNELRELMNQNAPKEARFKKIAELATAKRKEFQKYIGLNLNSKELQELDKKALDLQIEHDILAHRLHTIDYDTNSKTAHQDIYNAMHNLKEQYNKIESVLLKSQESQEIPSLKDEVFTDSKGKEHILTAQTQKQWLETFGLKSLNEAYIPQHSQEIKEALGNKEVKLTKGSLLKLIANDREKYLPEIKEVLDNPQLILNDKNDLIFAKEINDKLVFTSIGKDNDTHITIISNAPKTKQTMQNKLKNAKVLYGNAEALQPSKNFTETKQEAFSSEIIPQKRNF